MVWSADGIEFGMGQTVYSKDGTPYVVEEIAFSSDLNNEPEGLYAVDEAGNYEFFFGNEVYANNPHEAARRKGEVAATQHRGETIWVSESTGRPNQYRADTQHTSSSNIGNAIAWIDERLDKTAGSMEQDMGNMGESFDGGNAAGGAGPGGYIYDVSDYDTYARTYNTITDVPEGSDDSAPATTGSKRTARMVDHLNDNAPFRCGTFPSGEDAGIWDIEGCDNIIETGDWYYEDHDGQGLCASCAARYDDETNAYFSRRTASDMGIGHRWQVIDTGRDIENGDRYRIWRCEDCGETAATDLDRPWDHPDEFMGDCQARWNDGVYTATRKIANQYVEKRGDKWVVTQKGTGKVLSEHDTKEKAEASFRAMMSNKHGGSRHTGAESDDGYGTYDGMNDAINGQPALFTLTSLIDVPQGTDEWDYINAYVIAYNKHSL